MGHRLIEPSATYLVEVLTRAARFERFDRRLNTWVATDCPEKIAVTYLARLGEWRVPTLLGVVHTPTLRRDGSILEKPGFDHASRLLYDPGDAKFAPIPEFPTRNEASAALEVLLQLIEPFKCVGPEDRAAVLAAIITPGVRRSMPHAPLFAITAPVAGSLKSKLVDTASYIWSGHPAPVSSQGGKDGSEFEKRLSASLLAADTLISIDNCGQPLGGDLLCQMLSQLVCRVRIFGTLTNTDAPSNCCLYATGNNLHLVGDLTRRSLLASLDPRCERPEER
jgi:putative DNA primase/helicase